MSKRVSFDTSNAESEEGTPVRPALSPAEDYAVAESDETPRPSRSSLGSGGSKTPEAEVVTGKELAIVREEDSSVTPDARASYGFDGAPGAYWMSPSMDELQGLNRVQRQRIDRFTVGRDNVGSVEFKVPVDLSNINLDEICDGIVTLEPRSATVYPVTAKKPPVGKGLNVPARISLEQSWPRSERDRGAVVDPKRLAKHIERLKRIPDTTFELYDKDTGVWVFAVEHFTTYGLDDEDDDDDDVGQDDTAPVSSSPQDSAAQPTPANVADLPMEDSIYGGGQHRVLPGTFDAEQDAHLQGERLSFLGVSSADSAPNVVQLSLEDTDDGEMGEEYDVSDDEDMTRPSTGHHPAAEHDEPSFEGSQETRPTTPGGILRARMRAMKDSAAPMRLEVADGDDWMETLRKTVSPVKRDRQLLREMNESFSTQTEKLIDFDKDTADENRTSTRRENAGQKMAGFGSGAPMDMDKGRGFATSIDLMNSLFEKPKPALQSFRASVPLNGFPKVGCQLV